MSVLSPISEKQTMKVLVSAVQEMSLARNLESVMRIVRTAARRLTGADGATFVLRDQDKCYYADEDAIAPLWKGQRFPLGACISGWAMINRKPAVIEDIYKDSRIPIDAYRPTFVKSLLMVPVRSMDPIAAIGNYWAHRHLPSDEEIEVLQSLADITAVNMENIQVYNELEQRVKERTRELIDSLEREKKMNAATSRMVSIASHEFKTPLTTILSSTFLLESYEGAEGEDKKKKQLGKIKSSVENLNTILNDFLVIDRLDQGKTEMRRESFHLPQFIESIVDELQSVCRIGQKVRYTHEGGNEIVGDRKVLRHILVNLISNACKYSAEHQPIDLYTSVTDAQISITVRDYGIGIPDEEQQHIFANFFRASNASEIQGTGLGLTIVKRYVDLLDGEISFESTPGKGTSFQLRI